MIKPTSVDYAQQAEFINATVKETVELLQAFANEIDRLDKSYLITLLAAKMLYNRAKKDALTNTGYTDEAIDSLVEKLLVYLKLFVKEE